MLSLEQMGRCLEAEVEDGIEKAGWGSAQEIHPKGNGKGRTGQRGKQTHSEDAAEASANPMGGGGRVRSLEQSQIEARALVMSL